MYVSIIKNDITSRFPYIQIANDVIVRQITRFSILNRGIEDGNEVR